MSLAEPAYSSTRRSGSLVFVSGQLGIVEGDHGDVAVQTRRALDRVTALVAERGGGRDDVLKCTVFLARMSDWGAMDAVFADYFADPRPARAAVGAELALGALVEIEAIACLSGGTSA